MTVSNTNYIRKELNVLGSLVLVQLLLIGLFIFYYRPADTLGSVYEWLSVFLAFITTFIIYFVRRKRPKRNIILLNLIIAPVLIFSVFSFYYKNQMHLPWKKYQNTEIAICIVRGGFYRVFDQKKEYDAYNPLDIGYAEFKEDSVLFFHVREDEFLIDRNRLVEYYLERFGENSLDSIISEKELNKLIIGYTNRKDYFVLHDRIYNYDSIRVSKKEHYD